MPKFNYTLHHASLIVTDTETSVAFYRDILGMEQTERPDLGCPGAWFQLGAQQIHLLELNNPDPTTGRPEHGGRDRHVALTVQELAPIRQVLDEKGVIYSMSKSGRKALFCRDPDGNAVEILQQG